MFDDVGYASLQQPTVPQQNYPPVPPGSYPMGQQLPSQPAESAPPPAYAAGKFIVRSYHMQTRMSTEKGCHSSQSHDTFQVCY